ncbi:CoA ester lyase [Pseudomonas shirazica]|uniref:HpcH/HpaI aldolase/citrate lyase family protein n=1 Tax=Pseudomonas asiatica TaxID=2219225 RepID=UPI00209B6138|nr:aldolase/citrate lyase family protein [Pseudomonas asiatica]MCO7535990.1 aldolase/citrate lyase family protein [Pseudomonas asiatica]MCO7549582.1 aldolase/citrate lyase family protein [Pseudomonas asiatica]MCO7559714.1 aldolase/citrate lyase family protein [Pseudomonas asiatica]UQB77127.1 CoA ester lyase [Pseudomonas shirazica]
MKEFIPDRILFGGGSIPRRLPVVDHYAGIERFMYKALELQANMDGAFDVTLDFEDGSLSGNECEQIQLIAAVLNDGDYLHGRVGIRIHDASSNFWRLQCEHTIRAGLRPPAYVTLPKVTGVAQVKTVAAYIAELCEQAGMQQRVTLHVMVEDLGVLGELEAIVRLPEVECVSFGLLDYVSSFAGALPMSLINSPNEFASPIINDVKVRISTLCQIHGKVASHSLCSELKDAQVVTAHAARAFNELGFRRMWSIHPDQIEPILKASRPEQVLIERAVQILVLAHAEGWAPIRHDNQLHDRASYRYFWGVLKAAYASAIELPECTRPLFASVRNKEDSHVGAH